jgi:TM2 domain-containing membrane protein YozV
MSEENVPEAPQPSPSEPQAVPQPEQAPPPPPEPQQAPYAPPQDPAQGYQYAPQPQQPYAPQPGYQYAPAQPQSSRTQGIGSPQKDKWVAAILAFVLGTLGIHKFYLGYKTEGIIMLLVAILGAPCFGLGILVMAVISLIEAVRYVILTQDDFERTYVYNSKSWF